MRPGVATTLRRLRAVGLCAAALHMGAAALAQDGAAPAQEVDITNAFCPVMPEEPVDPNFFVEHEGRRVYLCCRRCLTTFQEDPAPYLANLAAFQQPDTPPAPAPDQPEPASRDQSQPATTPAASAEFDPIEYAGRFHVVLVHFPVALLVAAAFFEIAGLAAPRSNARIIVRGLVGLGAVSAVVAAPLGLATAAGVEYSGTLGWVFWWHRALGIAAAALAVLTWLAVERRRRLDPAASTPLATTLVIATAVLVGVTGHFGGSLVYGWERLWPPL